MKIAGSALGRLVSLLFGSPTLRRTGAINGRCHGEPFVEGVLAPGDSELLNVGGRTAGIFQVTGAQRLQYIEPRSGRQWRRNA